MNNPFVFSQLGITKLASGRLAGSTVSELIPSSLKKFLNANYGNTLYGAEIADKARKGIGTVLPYGWTPAEYGYERVGKRVVDGFSAPSANGFFDRVAKKLQGNVTDLDRIYDAKTLANPSAASAMRRNMGVLRTQDPGEYAALGKNKLKASFPVYDKLVEAQKVFPGFIADTKSLSELTKGVNLSDPKALRAALDSAYGKDKWVLKHVGAYNSLGHRGTIKPFIFMPGNGDKLNQFHGKAKDWMVQQKKDLQGLNWFEKLFHNPGNRTASGLREYRIHAVNGKVIPYSHAGGRGSEALDIVDRMLPWQRKSLRDAYSTVQQALDKAPKKYRNSSFGFDVAFDKTTGKPIIIEANPSNATGMSAWHATPIGLAAENAAIRGELPLHEIERRLRLGAVGAGTAGTLGVGSYGLSKYNDLKEAQKQIL